MRTWFGTNQSDNSISRRREQLVKSIVAAIKRFLGNLLEPELTEISLWSLSVNSFNTTKTFATVNTDVDIQKFIEKAEYLMNQHWIDLDNVYDPNHQQSSDYYQAIKPAIEQAKAQDGTGHVILISYGGAQWYKKRCEPINMEQLKLSFIQLGVKSQLVQCAKLLQDTALSSGGMYENAVSMQRKLNFLSPQQTLLKPGKARPKRITVSNIYLAIFVLFNYLLHTFYVQISRQDMLITGGTLRVSFTVEHGLQQNAVLKFMYSGTYEGIELLNPENTAVNFTTMRDVDDNLKVFIEGILQVRKPRFTIGCIISLQT